MGPELERELGRLVRAAQAEGLPGITAAVVRDGRVLWADAVGLADVSGERVTPDHQHRIGSITKTFTAVAVMQLRDAGLLALDDPLVIHLADAGRPEPTIRRSALPPRRDPAGAARYGLGDVRLPVRPGAGGKARRRGAGASGGQSLALLEPRLRAARRGGRAGGRDAVRPLRRGAHPRPARDGADRVHRDRSRCDALLGRSLRRRRPRGADARRGGERRRRGFPLEHRRRPVYLGFVPRRSRWRCPRSGDGCRDGRGSGDGRPRALDARLGPRARALAVGRPRAGGPRGRDARLPRRRLRLPRASGRRGCPHECREPR